VESSLRAIGMGGRLLQDDKVKLGGLEGHEHELLQIDNLILLGCGTSYYAGMVAVHYFKEMSGFNTVALYDGAEFTVQDIPTIGNTGLVFLS
jgi:glucosamine--fructose-6-phosphate aminotransferase (isomerizing)